MIHILLFQLLFIVSAVSAQVPSQMVGSAEITNSSANDSIKKSDQSKPENVLDINNYIKKFTPRTSKYIGKKIPLSALLAEGVWSRIYSQNSVLFNIPSVVEEILVISPQSEVLWTQSMKTPTTILSHFQRRFIITFFEVSGILFGVFHYENQDPQDVKIQQNQGYFIRFAAGKEFLQMSKSPSFEKEYSIYWHRLNSKYTMPKNFINTMNQ